MVSSASPESRSSTSLWMICFATAEFPSEQFRANFAFRSLFAARVTAQGSVKLECGGSEFAGYGLMASWLVALKDEPQANQGKHRLDVGDGRAFAGYDRGEPTGRDDCGHVAQFCHHRPHHAIHLAGESVNDPGLQALDCVLADYPGRFDQLDLAQLGGSGGQRVDGNLDAWSENPAEKFALA